MLEGVGVCVIRKWFDIISDHKIGLRERMFRISTAICMVALIFTLPMGRNILNYVILVVSLAAISLIVRVSIRKGRGTPACAMNSVTADSAQARKSICRTAYTAIPAL